jgi:hypothetical protein
VYESRSDRSVKGCMFAVKLKQKSWTPKVCLDRAKNSVRIEELRIANEDSEKIVIFRLA